MNPMVQMLVIQLSVTVGVAGLLWPEKLVPVFDVLMFPWPATHKLVRTNAWGALVLAILLFAAVILRLHV